MQIRLKNEEKDFRVLIDQRMRSIRFYLRSMQVLKANGTQMNADKA